MKRPKAPEPTAQELAGVARQSRMLDEETEEMEKRLKAAARSKKGIQSMLGPGMGRTSGGTRRNRTGSSTGTVSGSSGTKVGSGKFTRSQASNLRSPGKYQN